MEIYLIFVWYISCLHLCRLPRLRMEICRWWGKLFHCLPSSVWSVLSKWPPDCPSSVPRSPAATRSSPPLIGRDLVDHSGEEKRGGWGGGGGGGICTYQLLPHCTGDLTLLHCTQVHTSASIKHSHHYQARKKCDFQFINSCLDVKPWQTTQFSTCVLLACFLAKIFTFCRSPPLFE